MNDRYKTAGNIDKVEALSLIRFVRFSAANCFVSTEKRGNVLIGKGAFLSRKAHFCLPVIADHAFFFPPVLFLPVSGVTQS